MMSYQGVPVEKIAAGRACQLADHRGELPARAAPVITTGAEAMARFLDIKTRPTSRFRRHQTVILAFT
jgi:hypothetical protein